MKFIRLIYSGISAILTLIIIMVSLLALLLGVSGMDRQNPRSIFGFRAFIVLTSSMAPEFDAGSLIIIKETSAENLQVEDIITYKPFNSNDTLLTHRIVKISEDSGQKAFITRGDANNTDDPNPVEPEAILGRTIFYMDGLGTFIVNLRTPSGIAGMIAVIAVGLFIIPYLLSLKKSRPKQLAEDIDKIDEDENIDTDETGKTGETETTDNNDT